MTELDFNFRTLRDGRRAASAMTLVEVIFAIVVLSTMLLASLGAVGGAARGRIGQQESARGNALARQLLSEIMQTRYKDLQNAVWGIETGESRSTFDDVDDYNGLTETSAKASDGTVLAAGAGWTRSVTVDWVTTANPTVVSATDSGLKRILVTVTSPTGRVTIVGGLRSQNDGYEHTPGTQTTYLCHVGLTLQVGSNAASGTTQGVTLNNLVP